MPALGERGACCGLGPALGYRLGNSLWKIRRRKFTLEIHAWNCPGKLPKEIRRADGNFDDSIHRWRAGLVAD